MAAVRTPTSRRSSRSGPRARAPRSASASTSPPTRKRSRTAPRGSGIARSAALHDDSATATAVTTVWDRNTGEVGWNAFAGVSHEEFETYFKEQHRVWGRPTFVTGSTRGRRLGPPRRPDRPHRHGLRAATGDDRRGLAGRAGAAPGAGVSPVCLQGYGPDEGRRFAAIFESGEALVVRVVRRRAAGASAIYEAMSDLMMASNIRGAALALVDGTRLVLARGYTRAEPDYPTSSRPPASAWPASASCRPRSVSISPSRRGVALSVPARRRRSRSPTRTARRRRTPPT